MQKCFQNNSFQTPLCSVHTIISCKKGTPIPDTAAKGVDMPHMNKPYKSGYRCHRYRRFPRISSSFLRCAYIIAFLRCRFGKETSAAQSPPVRNLEALLLLRYNNCCNKFQEKHDEESTAAKGYSIFDPYFLQRLCRQFADSEALYHAEALCSACF